MVKIGRIGALSLLAALTAAGAAAPAPAAARTVKLVINNFRYCAAPPCGPQDQGYVRGSDGGSQFDNPLSSVVVVRPGDKVVWTYMDPFCDMFDQCPGHEVRFENGTPTGGKRIGFAKARSGSQKITWIVPTSARGKTLYYFCDVGDFHWQVGLTGILRVAK